MKNILGAVLFIVSTLTACYAGTSSIIYIAEGKNINGVSIKNIEPPTKYELSVIHFILKNTKEINIHRMRGETENEIYIDKDGHREAVYDKDHKLVTNYNKGSYNYSPYGEKPIRHFIDDILPWLKWGNAEDDPTSLNERLFYYTLDLNHGIQSYIFSDEELPEILFDPLPDEEKAVYIFFKYILFNKNYKIVPDIKTKELLKQSAEDYWIYFGEVQNILGVKQ